MTEPTAVPAAATTAHSAQDRAFPRLHPRPAAGWLNDPNGVCRFDGRWHVFFQWNPDSARSWRIRWGHLSSTDLVHWTTEPAALLPRDGEPDSFGCWTGCITDDDRTPTAVYSGVVDDSGHSVVLLARSDRELRDWRQDGEPVLAMPDPSRFTDARDPYVFHFGGHRWAVLGAGHRQGEPAALAYRVDDLTDWHPAGTLLDTSDPVATSVAAAHVWECPNLFEVDGRWVLIVSLMGPADEQSNKVRYLVGDLEIIEADTDEPQLRFRPSAGGLLDTGPACYAPQVVTTPERALLWGWAWELRDQSAADAAGWAGSLTLPRELHLAGDQLVSRPASELDAVLGAERDISADTTITEPCFLIRFAGPGTLSADGDPVLEVDEPTDVWVDGSVVEAYPASGIPYTTRGYPASGWTVDGADRLIGIVTE